VSLGIGFQHLKLVGAHSDDNEFTANTGLQLDCSNDSNSDVWHTCCGQSLFLLPHYLLFKNDNLKFRKFGSCWFWMRNKIDFKAKSGEARRRTTPNAGTMKARSFSADQTQPLAFLSPRWDAFSALAFCTSSRACPIWHGRIPLLEFRNTARPSVPPQPLVQALPNRRDCGLRLGQLRDLCAKEGEASAGPAAASNHIMPMFGLGRAARSRIEMENAGKAERR
jgi:hypothetical protein